MTVEDNTRVAEFLQILKEMESMHVEVGILSSNSGEILMIANVHEFGVDIPVTPKMKGYFRHEFGINLKTSVIKIPERSFIRSSYDDKRDDIAKSGEELLDLVLEGVLAPRDFYEMLGQTAADTIRDYLVKEVNSPPNTALTIENKGSSNPLVDTGRLMNSIAYQVVGG